MQIKLDGSGKKNRFKEESAKSENSGRKKRSKNTPNQLPRLPMLRIEKTSLRLPILFIVLWGTMMVPVCEAVEWVEVWSDEFEYTGKPDPSKWGYDLGGGGFGNAEVQTYTDELENARVEDGVLKIEVHQSPTDRSFSYTSARLVTREKQSLQYGRVEIRAKLPSETGTWAAVWMLSTDALYSDAFWPDNGEIDIIEHVGYEEDPLFLAEKGVEQLENVHSTIHTKTRNFQGAGGIGGRTFGANVSSEFHVYAMEWDADSMQFSLDGEVYFRVNKATDVGISVRNPPAEIWPYWPFDQRFHLILNIAVGGNWGGHFRDSFYPDSPYGPTGINHGGEWPQRMVVDYIRMYKAADRVNIPSVLPGSLNPVDQDDESGFLYEKTTGASSELNFRGIDQGDFARFYVNSAAAGGYLVSAEVATAFGNQVLLIENETLKTSIESSALQATGGANSWQLQSLGVIELRRGINVLKVTSMGTGFKLGPITLENPPVGVWQGYPLDKNSVADTGSWLGPIETQYTPYFYAPKMDSWIYLPESSVPATNQWIFVYAPQNLKPRDLNSSPWFYSPSADKWFYADVSAGTGLTPNAQWIFFLN